MKKTPQVQVKEAEGNLAMDFKPKAYNLNT